MSYFFQPSLFSYEEFIGEYDDNIRLVMVLSVLGRHFEPLIAKLERERMGRRDSYPVRVMMNSLLASYVYQIPVKNELIRELSRNGSLRRIVGITSVARVPKPWQYSRFIARLAEDENLGLLDEAFEACVDEIAGYIKGFGRFLSIDGTAVSSYSTGRKDKKTGLASDPDGAWGIREQRKKGKDGKVHKIVKKWFGYLVTLVVDCESELPVAYDVSPANASEMKKLPEMFDHIKNRHENISPRAVMADAGYDSAKNCAYVLGELDALPIIKMRLVDGPDAECTTSLCRCTELGVPICYEDSKMVYWGRDGDYLKWRCPAVMERRRCRCTLDNCTTSAYGAVLKINIEEDPRRFPGLSRDSKKWKRLYRKRTASERLNSRLKEHLLLDKHHSRGKAKVTVHVAMSLLVMLAGAIAMAEKDKLDSIRRIVSLAA
jgi:transposase, IS5 family